MDDNNNEGLAQLKHRLAGRPSNDHHYPTVGEMRGLVQAIEQLTPPKSNATTFDLVEKADGTAALYIPSTFAGTVAQALCGIPEGYDVVRADVESLPTNPPRPMGIVIQLVKRNG